MAEGNEQDMLHETKQLIEEHTPITLSDLSVFPNDNTGSNTFFIENIEDAEYIQSLKDAEANEAQQELTPDIEVARDLVEDYDFEKGLQMCLSLLKRDYDDIEAHMLVQECFHALGFKSELVLKVRTDLKVIMLDQN